ncbi:hypothetical protein [Sulfitobacter sp. 1A13679]|uniref:hypothetical protein n=1 Tax=Sulfitobacter sp. 1A13679 TaxID=3368597 RepID=UPI00374A1AF7
MPVEIVFDFFVPFFLPRYFLGNSSGRAVLKMPGWTRLHEEATLPEIGEEKMDFREKLQAELDKLVDSYKVCGIVDQAGTVYPLGADTKVC